MRINLWLLILLSLFLITSLFAAEQGIDHWAKARQIAEENYLLVPGRTHQWMETVDDRSGKVYQASDITIAHFLDEEGEIVSELLEKEIGGEEADHPDNELMVNSLLSRDMTPERKGIFFTEIGEDLRVEFTGNKKEINGFRCVEYQVKFTTLGENDREVTFNGSYWLDEDSGAPIYNKFFMDKTPRFVREIMVERWFNYEPDTNIWHLDEMVSQVQIRILLKRMTNTTRMTFTDYWLYETEGS